MFELLGTMANVLHGMIDSPWLWVVVFMVAGLDAVLPFMPSETTVVIVGVLIASDPTLLVLLILVAATGAFAGDYLAYTIGRHYGRRVTAWLMRSDQGRRRHHWAQQLFSRHGSMLIIAGRYIAGVRSVTMLTAGMLRYPTRQFLFTDAAAATIWASYAALIGYVGGATFEGNPIRGMLLAFGIGLAFAGLIEVARQIAARAPPGRSPGRSATTPGTRLSVGVPIDLVPVAIMSRSGGGGCPNRAGGADVSAERRRSGATRERRDREVHDLAIRLPAGLRPDGRQAHRQAN